MYGQTQRGKGMASVTNMQLLTSTFGICGLNLALRNYQRSVGPKLTSITPSHSSHQYNLEKRMSIYNIHSPTSQIIYTVTLHPTPQKTRISLRHNTNRWNGTFANTKETATLVQIIQGHAPRNVEASIDVIDDEILGMPKEENKRYIILTIQGGGKPRYNHQVNAGPHKNLRKADVEHIIRFP